MALKEKLAEWAWGSNPSPEVSPEVCLKSFPILTSPCLIGLIVKGIGIAIICGAFLNKAPLFFNIIKNKSVAGMSTGAVYGETIMYANSAFYSILRQNPFTAWGETFVVMIQSLGVCYLLWIYKDDPKISVSSRFLALLGFGVYLFVVFVVLSPEYYYLLMAANWPVLLYSRGLQILTFWRCKHTGTQSLITTGMNLMGSCIRLLTTIKEVGWDMTLLSSYAISAALNITLVTQFVIYREKTEKYLKTIREKKD